MGKKAELNNNNKRNKKHVKTAYEMKVAILLQEAVSDRKSCVN